LRRAAVRLRQSCPIVKEPKTTVCVSTQIMRVISMLAGQHVQVQRKVGWSLGGSRLRCFLLPGHRPESGSETRRPPPTSRHVLDSPYSVYPGEFTRRPRSSPWEPAFGKRRRCQEHPLSLSHSEKECIASHLCKERKDGAPFVFVRGRNKRLFAAVALSRKEKGCEFPVASQSRSLPQITATESLAPPSICRAAAPVFYGCAKF
jgi:hypothetical protein